MRSDHDFYSYHYLYKISNNPDFIQKMITLFINSITEYRYDLQQLETSKSIPDMKKLIHKLKPSVLSMEVQGAKDIIPKLEEAGEWSEDIAAQVTKLVEIFTTIKPMMEKDLEEIN